MRFHKEIRFPAGHDAVWAMLADPAFRERVAQEAGAGAYDVSVRPQGDGMVATVRSTQSTDGLPSAATKVLGSSYDIEQEETWESPQAGTLRVSIPGKPGRVTGTVSLRGDGAETVQSVDAEVKVSIPLVGGKVEKIIGSALGHVLKVQERVGADWLG